MRRPDGLGSLTCAAAGSCDSFLLNCPACCGLVFSPRRRFFFNIGLAGFSAWMLMAMYLIIWLKYIKKIAVEWEEYWPQAIPVATVCAVLSILGFVVAFWPVWGWLTLPAIFVLFLGVLNLAHFVPL